MIITPISELFLMIFSKSSISLYLNGMAVPFNSLGTPSGDKPGSSDRLGDLYRLGLQQDTNQPTMVTTKGYFVLLEKHCNPNGNCNSPTSCSSKFNTC